MWSVYGMRSMPHAPGTCSACPRHVLDIGYGMEHAMACARIASMVK
jgi:hypothetical protein